MTFATLYHLGSFLFERNDDGEISRLENRGVPMDLLGNILLISGFVIVHSALASDPVKRFWKRNQSIACLQRSTYIIVSTVFLELLISYWRPFNINIWELSAAWESRLSIIYIVGWIVLLVESFTVDHLELFGLKQLYYYYKGQSEPLDEKTEETKRFYEHLRHPFALGFLLVFWVTPVMTLDRLCLAVAMTAYIVFGNGIDSRDIDYVESRLFSALYSIVKNRPKLSS